MDFACTCFSSTTAARSSSIQTSSTPTALITPLCDATGDGLCDVSDIIAANIEIFSPTSTSICTRQPVPGP
jgi:hypothetical protein